MTGGYEQLRNLVGRDLRSCVRVAHARLAGFAKERNTKSPFIKEKYTGPFLVGMQRMPCIQAAKIRGTKLDCPVKGEVTCERKNMLSIYFCSIYQTQ